jgi:hypothetical protein
VSRPIRSYPEHEQAAVVERRLKPTSFGKGLGFVSAVYYKVRYGGLSVMGAKALIKGKER